MKILSIIIPAYNVEKYLKEAVAPYLQLDFSERLEVLIINDGSKDNTLQLAKKYEEEHPEIIKVINKENGGHGSTINIGIRCAEGKYFKVVDGDDWVDEKVLKRLLDFLERFDVDMIATGFTIVYEGSGQKEEVRIRKVEYGKKYQFIDICEKIEHIGMHSIIFKTQILKENNICLDEHCFYVDVEYNLFPLKWVNTIVFLDELLYQYRVGRPGQSVNIQSMIKNKENHERVIKRIMDWIKTEDLSSALRNYAEKRLLGMIEVQYLILFHTGTGEKERKELIKYDIWLKNNSHELYDKVTQKKILLMRKMYFRNYYFIKFLYRLFGKKIEYIK